MQFKPIDLIVIIPIIFTGLAGLINVVFNGLILLRANKIEKASKANREILEVIDTKANDIKDATDGNLTDALDESKDVKQRNDHLNRIITKLIDQLPPGALEEAQTNAYRRASDIPPAIQRKDPS